MSGEQVSIVIQAPSDASWNAIADVQSWPQWTPSITRVERLDDGPLGTGSRTRIKQPRMLAIVWEVTGLEDGREFTWVGRSPGITTTARHILEPDADGTRLTLTVEHRGPLAGLVARLTRKRTLSYLSLEASGLKASTEASVASE
jgi:uncharacterized membrane protein